MFYKNIITKTVDLSLLCA